MTSGLLFARIDLRGLSMEIWRSEPWTRLSGQTDCGTSGDMTDITRTQREFLSSPVGNLAAMAARPRSLAIGCIIAVSALGWIYLAFVHASGTALLDAICTATGVSATTRDVTLVGAMWIAMTFAMMLPNAAPMVLTYSEIADTAARKSVGVISPFVLVAGYAVVWLGFAIVAAVLQASFASTSLSPAPALVSAAAFGVAGLYQFSSMKRRLPPPMPCAVPVFLVELADHDARRVSPWRATGTVLPWLLLGGDGVDARRRCDEHILDGGARRVAYGRTAGCRHVVDPRGRRRFDRFRGISGNWCRSRTWLRSGSSKVRWHFLAVAPCFALACCRSANTPRPRSAARLGPASVSMRAISTRSISWRETRTDDGPAGHHVARQLDSGAVCR